MKLRAILLAAAILATTTAAASTFTVVNADDAGPGSLRQAILDANANPGEDTIAFAIPGAGVQTITLLSPLEAITDPAIIDGATQPGFPGSPLVSIEGSQAGPGSVGIDIQAGPSTVRALTIGGFRLYGIRIAGGTGSAVEGCVIGLDPTGTLANGNGVAGIKVSAAGNRIGGTTAAERNVIAAQSLGIDIEGPGGGNLVQGNFIGTRADGTGRFASSLGILTRSPGNVIGGAVSGAGNLVSGHLGEGIEIQAGSDGTIVQGNRVGTDASGTYAIQNTGNGLSITGANDVLVGGTEPGAGNLVSGNLGSAVVILGARNIVLGNLLGTDASGAAPLPNGGGGVSLGLDANASVIGGPEPGAGNVIAFNAGPGVRVAFGVDNAVRGNSIYENGGLAIDLLPLDPDEGPTANDHGDVDEGGNHLQNYPVLSAVEAVPGSTRIQGFFSGASAHLSIPSDDVTYILDFYADGGCTPRPREFPQARAYLGSADLAVGHTGEAAFDVTLPVTLGPGDVVTATATDPAGNTSELFTRLVFASAPRSGPAQGGSALAIHGTNFEPGATVAIGGAVVSSVAADDATIAAVSPGLPPGSAVEITVINPGGTAGTLPLAWVADFLDVPESHLFHDPAVALVSNGVAAGCGAGLFCVDGPVTRAQMAPMLLKAKNGICLAPAPCAGLFADVSCASPFADWIEALSAEGITGGCGGGNYCPQDPVRRDQMAPLLLKALHGAGYVAPSCTGVFLDAPCPGPFTDWIEQLAAEGITGGCGGGNYCPANPNTRGQMAAFLVGAFSLP
ncbi:MAG: S-layer homology domain-containing protein [Thermoanaerobaculia bacterium]